MLAAMVFFLPAVLLAAVGVAQVYRAVRKRNGGSALQLPVVLGLAAAIGTLGCSVLAMSPLWSDAQYGVIILPVAAVIIAAVWNVICSGVLAVLTALFSRSGSDAAASGEDRPP